MGKEHNDGPEETKYDPTEIRWSCTLHSLEFAVHVLPI